MRVPRPRSPYQKERVSSFPLPRSETRGDEHVLRRLKLLCVCQGGLYHGDADFHEHEHEHGCGVERAISITSDI